MSTIINGTSSAITFPDSTVQNTAGLPLTGGTLTGTTTFTGGVANAYGFGVGTAVPSSGAGIAFPATQSASSDANTLDDYEEGTWTPAIGGTTTYVSADTYGSYVKIGRVVTVTFSMSITTVGGAYSVYGITNLPFTSTASRTQYGTVGNYSGINTSVYSLTSYTDPSATNCNYLGKTAQTTGSVAPLNMMTNGTYITGTFSYICNT